MIVAYYGTKALYTSAFAVDQLFWPPPGRTIYQPSSDSHPDRQQCNADGFWYSCTDSNCNLKRSCASNSGLEGCACPEAPAPLLVQWQNVQWYQQLIRFWLPSSPFIYLLLPCRFWRVLKMESAHIPRFTELLHRSLALRLLSDGIADIVTIRQWQENPIEEWLNTSVYLIGSVAVILAYQTRRKHGDSLTLALNYSIVVYLLAYGVEELLDKTAVAFILPQKKGRMMYPPPW
jgi:hypothetical protein